jgi:hypothetical protein
MTKKLNKQEIINRLCQYDVYLIMKDINNEDYSWLADIREYGFKGYANYTNQELIEEWEESKDGYNSMIINEKQYYNVSNQCKKVKEVA